MKTNLIGENITLTQSLKDYTNKKVEKIEKFFNDKEDVTLKINFKTYPKKDYKCEIILSAPSFPVLSVKTHSDDMYSSIDLTVDKLVRKIKKELTKVNRKQRKIK